MSRTLKDAQMENRTPAFNFDSEAFNDMNIRLKKALRERNNIDPPGNLEDLKVFLKNL